MPGFLGKYWPKRLKQPFPKSAPKSSLKRQHLLRCRNWYGCQPEDVPAALWFYLGVKDLDLAFGQASSRSQWRSGNCHCDGTGECCTAGAFLQQLAGLFLSPFGSQYQAYAFAINWEFRDVEKWSLQGQNPLFIQSCSLFPGFWDLFLLADWLFCRELARALAAEKALPVKALSA